MTWSQETAVILAFPVSFAPRYAGFLSSRSSIPAVVGSLEMPRAVKLSEMLRIWGWTTREMLW